MGVPQGSILGPLFYIIYVNDLYYDVNCTPRLYADDTCLLVEGKNEGHLQNLLTTELYNLSNWMILNQLTINPTKSTILVIQPTLRSIPIKIQLNIDDECVKSSVYVKYLGMNLDQHLNYKSHIESIAKKVARATGILWKLRKFLPAKTLLNLYNALIKPHLLYGLVIWGPTVPCTTQQPLQLSQNNAVRAITGISRFEHITTSFRRLDILKIHDFCKIEIALNMHKFKNDKLSNTFQNYFTLPSNVHHYSSRSKLQLTFYVPKFRLVRFQKSFKYRGVKIWNSIE